MKNRICYLGIGIAVAVAVAVYVTKTSNPLWFLLLYLFV